MESTRLNFINKNGKPGNIKQVTLIIESNENGKPNERTIARMILNYRQDYRS